MSDSVDNKLYIGFSSSEGGFFSRLLGKLIRLFTGGNVNHAFLLYYDTLWKQWMTVGANANGVTPLPLSIFEQTRKIESIFLPKFDLWLGAQASADDIGKEYNYGGLIGMAWVTISKRLKWQSNYNWLSNHNELFCSEWVAQIIDIALVYVTMPDVQYKWTLMHREVDTIDPQTLCSAATGAPELFTDVTETLFEQRAPAARCTEGA